MKKITLIIFVFTSFFSFSQNISMQNGTFTQCSGILYDSGGGSSNYSSNENFVITICPENNGQQIRLQFTSFSTQLNADIVTIYDGDSTAAPSLGSFSGGSISSPGLVGASASNPTGCLTVQFISDGANTGPGFAAQISCYTPCQDIVAQLESSVPAINNDGNIEICQGDQVTFNGSGDFSVDGTGATYTWDFGNGETGTGQSASTSYTDAGIYIVNLTITDTNPLGCSSTNVIDQIVRVSSVIDFTGTEAAQNVLCYGETTTIEGVATPGQFEDCAPEIFDQTYLEDTQSTGQAASYSSTITVNCYGAGQVITNPSQITNLCINIEHSFLGDLDMYLVAPNGAIVYFAEYGDGDDPGYNLGIPDQADNGNPGTGWDYCFSPAATVEIDDAPVSGNTVPAGTYSALTTSSFDNLIGAPLNGDWQFFIVDLWAADDGTLFSWNLNFDSSLLPPPSSIVAESWDTDPTITDTNGSVITVAPTAAGQYCYTYRVTDDFGCEYTEEVCIDVLPEIINTAPNNLFLCNPGSPPYLFDLTENTSIILASAPTPADLIVTYHETLANAENDTSPIGNAGSYEGTDGQTIYVRVEYLDSGCYEIETFTLNVTSQPTINPVGDLEICDDISNDGFEAFDLESQTLAILGAQPASDFTVTYYSSFANADTSTGALVSPYTNTSNPQPIFVRVERTGDPTCNNVSALPLFNLVVNPSDDATFNITPTCDGGTVTITGTSGGTFTFNPAPTDGATIDPNSGTVTGATSGATYNIEYTTSGTCPVSGSQVLSVPVIDDASFSMTPTCDGATASITGADGGTFAFNPVPGDSAVIDSTTGTVTNGTSGSSYTVEYTTSGTCPSNSTQSFTVISVDDPSFSLTATCDGATATVTGTAGGTFSFNPAPTDGAVINSGTGTITGGTSAASYTVEYTTSGTCPASSTQSVTVLTTDDATFTLTPTCDGGSATITGTAGGTFTFNPVPNDAAVIDASTGTVTGGTPSASYTIQYTTSGVCPASSTQVLNVLSIDNSSFTMTPTCDGATATITGVSGGSFILNPAPSDGAVINPASGLVTNATPSTSYTVEYTTNGTCPSSSTVTFTVNPLPLLFAPAPLVVCDDNVGDGLTSIDLSVKDTEITGGNPQYTVSYHFTALDADSGDSPLPVPYTNVVPNMQTVYVRVVDTTTGCYDTTELLLQVEQAPVANVPSPLEYCDPDNDGFGEFNLSDAEADVTGGAPGLDVSYHETLANAENNVNPLPLAYDNIVANTQTIYVRVVSSILTSDCATIVPLVLSVLPTPVVPLDIADYAICDTNSDGTVQFDLTTQNAGILGSQNPADYTLTYHLSLAAANSGTAPILNVGNYTNVSNPQTIYVRLEGANGCYKTGEFDLVVDLPPVTFQPSELALCDDEVADELTTFDLTVKNGEITGGDGSLTVEYFTTSAAAQSGTGPISPATSYVNEAVGVNPANPQTLYVRITDNDTGCTSFRTLTIRVLPNPEPMVDPADIILCDDTNTGDGQELFDLTQNQAYILDGAPNLTATYHETLGSAEAGTSPIADPTAYVNSNTDNTPQTIYVRVTNNTSGCYAVVDFDILVNPLPEVVAVADYILCEVNTDGFAQFDLSTKTAEVLNGQDPNLYNVTYHATQAGADNLTGALNTNYTNTVNPQQIFVAITNTQTGCSISTVSFFLEVDNGAEANSGMEPMELVACDYVGDNDGLAQFDLTENDAAVLDGQDAGNFIVTYYLNGADAEMGVNPIPYIYENTSNPQTIYVRVDNDTPDALGMDSSICYAVAELTLRVDLLPVFDLDDSYTLCVDTNGTEVIGAPVLDTGLSAADHTFEWSLDGTVLADQTGPSLTAELAGTYMVTVINMSTGCMADDSAQVVISSPPVLTAEVVTQAFSENSVIVATAVGDGQYEYSLDNGPWQESGTFEGVSYGPHMVTARDINGCGTDDFPVDVYDYPHFFTPNGDGYHDTWNIVGFESAKIYIFDRYGKLIKQISPSGQGWDGTYNGEPMPTSDYWFTVEYTEPMTDQAKEFKAHFTLKR